MPIHQFIQLSIHLLVQYVHPSVSPLVHPSTRTACPSISFSPRPFIYSYSMSIHLSIFSSFICLSFFPSSQSVRPSIPLIGSLDGSNWATFLKNTCGNKVPIVEGSIVGFPNAVPAKTFLLRCGRLKSCLGICPKLCIKEMTALRRTGSSIVSMS